MKKEIKNTIPVLKNTSIVAARGVSDESGLAQYIQNVQKIPVLSAEQEYEYATQWVKNQDKFAAEKLVVSHLRLVVSVAYDYKNYGIPVADLIASGNMGLMQAVQKFDPEKGFRFSTYAMFWIKAEIYETILNNWSIVRIGTSANQKKVFFNLARAKRALGIMDNNLNEEQTKQIAEYLEVPEKDVARMATRISARDLSLNAPMNSDDGASDILSNMTDGRDSIEETLEQIEFRKRGYELLVARKLKQPVATLESLSQKYGISRERVRQIEERAYKKLRDAILSEADEKK